MTDRVDEALHLPEGDAPTPDDPGYTDWVERVWAERVEVPVVSPEAIDRTLILEHLRRTPTERLAFLERRVNELLELRGRRRGSS